MLATIPALAHPVRIRQAIERLILPVTEWQTGDKAINEVPAVVSSDGGLIAR